MSNLLTNNPFLYRSFYQNQRVALHGIESFKNIVLQKSLIDSPFLNYLLLHSQDTENDIKNIGWARVNSLILSSSGIHISDFVPNPIILKDTQEQVEELYRERLGTDNKIDTEFQKIQGLKQNKSWESYIRFQDPHHISSYTIQEIDKALEEIYYFSPSLLENIRGFVKNIYIAVDDICMNSVSTPQMNGIIMLGTRGDTFDMYDYIDYITHETAHLCLFNLDIIHWPYFVHYSDEGRVLNSPLRIGKRNMYGVFHAFYVLVNLYSIFSIYQKSDREKNTKRILEKLTTVRSAVEKAFIEVSTHLELLTNEWKSLFQSIKEDYLSIKEADIFYLTKKELH